MRAKLPDEVDLMVGTPGYKNGRCIARVKAKLRVNPDLSYDELRCKKAAAPGRRTCVMHGAGSLKNPGGRPPIHGKRSQFAGYGEGLKPKVEQLLNDPEWADLRREIALLRALLELFIEKNSENLHDEDTQKHAARMADEVGVLVDRLHKILYGEEYTVNIYGIQAFGARVADAINSCITDEVLETIHSAEDLRLMLYHHIADIFGDPIESVAVPRLIAAPNSYEN